MTPVTKAAIALLFDAQARRIREALQSQTEPKSSACHREPWCCRQVEHDGPCSPAMLPDGSVIS